MKKNIRLYIYLRLTKCYLFTGFIFILMSFSSYAQDNIKQQANTAGMHKAIYWVGKGEYAKAKIECKKILQKNPKQTDANILLAKIYSWNKQFDSARTILTEVLQNHPDNKDALHALINVELWSKHYDKALTYADKGLTAYPNSEDFLIKKVKVYDKQGNYNEASKLINKTVLINPTNKEALKMQELIKNKKLLSAPKNAVGIYYQHDQFNTKYAPWNSVSAYFYTVRKWGGFSAAVNYASRFNKTGIQYELNLYPRISHSLRAYMGAAYSNDNIFPNYKFGASLYQKFLKTAELELGARYLKFKNLSPIIIYTGGLSYTYKHWRGTFLTYLTPQASTINQSFQASARYSFKNQNNNIMLVLSTGLSPRNYLDTISNKGYNYPKKSNRVELRYQTPFFSSKTLIKASAGYEKNEYYTGFKRERIFVGIGIVRLF